MDTEINMVCQTLPCRIDQTTAFATVQDPTNKAKE